MLPWLIAAAVASSDPEITVHLLDVVHTLRAEGAPAAASDLARSKRAELLDVLEQYAVAGGYPEHASPVPCHARVNPASRVFHGSGGRQPRFIDDAGTHCAVGYLIAVDDPALARAIDDADPLGFVPDMQLPAIDTWAAAHGFTRDELAWIQPNYVSFHPSCDDFVAPTPPVDPLAGCDDVDLAVLPARSIAIGYADAVCLDGCTNQDGYGWWFFVGNRGTVASTATDVQVTNGRGEEVAVRAVAALAPGQTVAIGPFSAADRARNATLTTSDPCREANDAAQIQRDTGLGQWSWMLDADDDGEAPVACGGVDCDDTRADLRRPDCLAGGSAPAASCEVSCEVYCCLKPLDAWITPPNPDDVAACLAGEAPEATSDTACPDADTDDTEPVDTDDTEPVDTDDTEPVDTEADTEADTDTLDTELEDDRPFTRGGCICSQGGTGGAVTFLALLPLLLRRRRSPARGHREPRAIPTKHGRNLH